MKKTWTLLAAALFLSASALTASAASPRTISVTGVGEVAAAADTATFNASIENTGATQEEAARENARRTRLLRTALIAAGAQFDTLSTGSYAVNPIYHYDKNGKRRFDGYLAQNQLKVKVNDLTKTGSIIDTAARNGADRIDSVEFYNRNKTVYKTKAYNEAGAEARAKAETAAAALGLTLGRVLSASETYYAPPTYQRPVLLMSKVAAADTATTPIEAEDDLLKVELNVTYEVF